MSIHKTSADRTVIVLAVTAFTVILLALAFGKSVKHATADGASVTGSSMRSFQNDADLSSIKETVGSLRGIHTGSMETQIPVAAKPLLTTLKHQLRDFIANRLRFQKRQVSTQKLQARTIVDLSELDLIVDEEGSFYDPNKFEKGYDYGDIYSITVTRPRFDFDVIAVTTTVGICCGEDTSLYLLRYESEEWKLWLADEKNDYDSIIDGRNFFQFGLSWPDQNEEYFVVTASVNPWCTSNWQSITYRVLRPGPEAYEPQVLLNRSQMIYLGEDPPYRLEVDDSAFMLKFRGQKYEDSIITPREGNAADESLKELVRCRVEGDAVIIEK
jgi:hypothetical protein